MQEDMCSRSHKKMSYALMALSIAVLAALAAFAVMRFGIQGPKWDTCNYLTNALFFSGNEKISYVILPLRPPLISLIVALPFYLGNVSGASIAYVDVSAYVLSGLCFYLLARQRFSCAVSFLALVAYATCAPVLDWLGFGYSTLFGVGISIAFALLTVASSERNPHYALLLWPVGMLMVLSWEAAPLVLLLPLFYNFFRWKKFTNYRYHVIGVAAALVMYLPFALILNRAYGGPFAYLDKVISHVVSAYGGIRAQPGDPFVELDRFYYLKGLPSALSPYQMLSLVVLAVLVVGMVLVMHRVSFSLNRSRDLFVIYVGVIAVALIVSVAFTFIISVAIIAALLLMLGRLVHADEHRSVAMDMMMFFWFFLMLAYYTNIDVKVTRFMIAFMPPFAYLVALGISGFFRLDRSVFAFRAIGAIVVMAVLATSALSVNEHLDPYGVYAKHSDGECDMCVYGLVGDITDHLVEQDPDYRSKNIHSMLWTYCSWILRQDVRVTDVSLFPERLEHELQMYGADYYLGAFRDLESYEYVYHNDEAFLFKRAYDVEKPEILYIGRNLENYIGEVLDYQYYVRNGESYIREYPDRVDDFTLEELAGYEAVILYNFAWNDLEDAMKLLETYVRGGGKVILDTSGNMDPGVWDLTYKALFGISSEREKYAETPVFSYSFPFKDLYSISDFVMEDGGDWVGMTYRPIEAESFDVLISADSNVVFAEQTMGSGHIYWIGGNLIFHSYSTYNLEEHRLVQEIFNYMYSK